MEENKHIISDSTVDYSASRIGTYTYFKTVWSKDVKLLQYFSSWNRENNMKIKSLDNLTMQDKLAIARHKKVLMKKLGLLKEPKEVKIIYMSYAPTNFYTEFAVEKKKIFQTNMGRYDKSQCVYWTKEKAELIKQYEEVEEKRNNELENIKNKIMKRP